MGRTKPTLGYLLLSRKERLTEHLLSIKNELFEFQPKRVVIDSISAMERVSGNKNFREFVVGPILLIKELQIATIFTAVTPQLVGGSTITEQHVSTITDSIILLRYIEIMGKMRRGIAILKMRGSWHDKDIREFIINDQGLHIGKPFTNISGILPGIPTQTVVIESEQMKDMFEN